MSNGFLQRERLVIPIKKSAYITTTNCKDNTERLMMKRMKSRKEYSCDDCGKTIREGDEYFHLNMSRHQFSVLNESLPHEAYVIIKRACVKCVDKKFFSKAKA